MKHFGILVLGALAAACGGPGAAPETAGAPNQPALPSAQHCSKSQGPPAVTPLATEVGSTVALGRAEGRLLAYVSDSDEQAIHVVDVERGDRLATTELPGTPSQMMFLPDGRLVVGLRDRARLLVLEASSPNRALTSRCSVETPAEPVGLARTRGGKRVVLVSAWSAKLTVFDSVDFGVAHSVSLERDPQSVVVGEDGSSAFVSHASGGRMSRVRFDSPAATEIEISAQPSKEVRQRLEDTLAHLANLPTSDPKKVEERKRQMLRQFGIGGRRANQGFALAKSPTLLGRIFSPGALVEPGDTAHRSPGYGTEGQQSVIASIAVIDERAGAAMTSSLVVPSPWSFRPPNQDLASPCLLPRAAAVDPETDTLLVGCFGIDAVVAYDAASANPVAAEKGRWRVPAGPTGIALDTDQRRAIVWSQFDRTLSILRLGDDELLKLDEEPSVREVSLPANPSRKLPVSLALGRLLFHATGDARIAADGRACASCHPGGRDDGLTWSTPNGPRRTRLLAGTVAGTAPYAWDGSGHDLEDHLADTFRRLSGAGGLRSLELDSLVAYVKSLKPPPRGLRADAASVGRGKEIFHSKSAACSSCHSGSRFTDNSKHDVKSKAESDRDSKFDTPPLVHLAGKAPYFHDGRYASLKELLVDTDGKMGHTSHLSPRQLDDLVAYLETL